MTLSLRNMLPQ